jgi:hypothetical protein
MTDRIEQRPSRTLSTSASQAFLAPHIPRRDGADSERLGELQRSVRDDGELHGDTPAKLMGCDVCREHESDTTTHSNLREPAFAGPVSHSGSSVHGKAAEGTATPEVVAA